MPLQKLSIQIKDDGKGIDPTKIKEKMIKLGREAELVGKSDDEIIQFIFDAGFSTKDSVSQMSGRGVGMDAIKAEVLRLGGNIRVKSALKVGTATYIVIPIPYFDIS